MSPMKESPEIKRKRVRARVRAKKQKGNGDNSSFDEDAFNLMDGEGFTTSNLEPINETDEDTSPYINRNEHPRLLGMNQDLLQI